MILDPLRRLQQPERAVRWDAAPAAAALGLDGSVASVRSAPRTRARDFFPSHLYLPLKRSLADWGRATLGCAGLSSIMLSISTASHGSSWVCAAPHGPFAFSYSLTRWEGRGWEGGETLLLQPNPLATDEVGGWCGLVWWVHRPLSKQQPRMAGSLSLPALLLGISLAHAVCRRRLPPLPCPCPFSQQRTRPSSWSRASTSCWPLTRACPPARARWRAATTRWTAASR